MANDKAHWGVAFEAPEGFKPFPADPMTLSEALVLAQSALWALACVWPNATERVFVTAPLPGGGIELFPFKAF